MTGHAIDEPFVLLDARSFAVVAMDRAMLGARVEARAHGVADDEADPPLATVVAAGESLRPFSPCHVTGTVSAAGLALSWVPRRIEALSWGGGDPDTSGARYSISISRSGATIVRETNVAAIQIDAADLAALGSGDLTIAVSEIGANGASRPALLTLVP